MNTTMRFAPPPRRVPLSLTLVSFFSAPAQVGWAILGMGMLFFRVFAGQADYSFVTFRGELVQTMGTVTGTETTGASEGQQPVIANHYEYSVAGRRLRGTSYTTGSAAAEGAAVAVEYKAGDPLRSRIAGMRSGVFGPVVLIVFIFPLVGLVIIAFSSRGGLRRARLLRTGVVTTGRLVAKEPTSVQVNRRRVFELTFEFTTRDGRRCQAKARSHETARMEDEHAEPLLYDPDQPSRAYVLDEVSGRPRVDELGELVAQPVAGFLAVIIPGLVIAAHLWLLLR